MFQHFVSKSVTNISKMADPSEEDVPSTKDRFEELCMSLNLDDSTKTTAWESYERICVNYTLEGDDIQWLACALYVACRRSVVPTVSNGIVVGNGVSLTQLLRSAKLSVIQFFSKMKKWADMANLPQQFRDKVDRLERNFAVSTVIFKKYQPIFYDLFKEGESVPRTHRGRNSRRLPCTSQDVFSFCWTLFVLVKGNFPAISDDLVNSYHLLLCSLDLVFANAVLANRRDLLNSDFQGLPQGYNSKEYRVPQEAPCIIDKLCEVYDGLVLEAKSINEHWWKPHIQKLIEDEDLEGNVEKLSNILDTPNFESNNKNICKKYEEYVLTIGDFDERIFLDKDADEEIGTPSKSLAYRETEEAMKRPNNQRTNDLCPATPLTNRRYLKEKDPRNTPVSTATQAVSKLQALLTGHKLEPSDTLESIFKECSEDPSEGIAERVKEMGQIFCQKYTQPVDEGNAGSPLDFAKRRLKLAESLYYKALESIMLAERKRLSNLTHLLEHDLFHRSLFACCLEVVIYAYNSQRTFPWVMEAFSIPPFHYYKVIELILRAEDGLSRDVVKHLNYIEEDILQDRAWRSNSPLWDLLRDTELGVPTCEDATIPGQTDAGKSSAQGGVSSTTTTTCSSQGQSLLSPIQHKRIIQLGGRTDSILQSPTSAHDRFSSPSPGTARRRLFTNDAASSSSTTDSSTSAMASSTAAPSATEASSTNSKPKDSMVVGKVAQIQAVSQVVTGAVTTTTNVAAALSPKKQYVVLQGIQGTSKYIVSPVKLVQAISVTSQVPSPAKAKTAEGEAGTSAASSSAPAAKPRRSGSLGIFFRKVYHLMNVRLFDMCKRLNINDELRRKIWTILEYALVNRTDIMKDRHLDQLIMCSIYILCKVTSNERQFQEIMKNYRCQPQAASHVYRSVLISSNQKESSSGSSTNGSQGSPEGSRTGTPSLVRSASTLPVPHPSSAPPTPTKMAGTASTFDDEHRGDLIKFYNSVFLSKMQKFALKFETSANGSSDKLEAPPLSPLPVPRPHMLSPRKVSSRHQVYVSPHKKPVGSPKKTMTYVFERSPKKVLKSMNNMVKAGGKGAIKRQILGDSTDSPVAKKLCVGSTNPSLQTRLATVQSDRQSASS
ncbi:retinoblastoma-like protein 1 [Diadema antillarum]|uniref:retinoblastoma-like protein 1 n=1 Tax=Diadema antillarum TaxID=105358 RepID=UPI003A888125